MRKERARVLDQERCKQSLPTHSQLQQPELACPAIILVPPLPQKQTSQNTTPPWAHSPATEFPTRRPTSQPRSKPHRHRNMQNMQYLAGAPAVAVRLLEVFPDLLPLLVLLRPLTVGQHAVPGPAQTQLQHTCRQGGWAAPATSRPCSCLLSVSFHQVLSSCLDFCHAFKYCQVGVVSVFARVRETPSDS